MKYLYKILILTLSLTVIGCQDDDTAGSTFSDTSSGWIEFAGTTTTVNFDSESIDVIGVPVKIEVPVTDEAFSIGYDLVQVAGPDPNTIFSNNGMLSVPANVYGTGNPSSPTIDFNLASLASTTETLVFDVVLKSSGNSKIKVGVAGSSRPTTHRVTMCPIAVGAKYSGDAFSDDLDLPANTFPPYLSNFTPVAGTTNMWDLDTTWGPDFVSLLTGGQVPPGSFPYPSTLTLNDDFTVIISSTDPNFPGGEGTFDPCSNTFTLKLTQALFTTDFTVDVTLSGI